MACGFDVGTYNLVCARRGADKIDYRREVNAFIKLELANRAFFNMMKVKAKVPLIERDNVAYMVGQAAIDMAYAMPTIELRRPMSDGTLNPKERDAFKILQLMCHSLVGRTETDREVLYYCIPANAVNAKTDADFHRDLLGDVFKSYKIDGKTLDYHHINEALALVYAELGDKQYTGVGLSFGSGMINFCYAMYASEVCSFSITNAGDWIDQQAAQATGETAVFINRRKQETDLTVPPKDFVDRAIQSQYRLMIDNTVANIKKTLEATGGVKSERPVDVIVAGGTSAPNGFVELVRDAIGGANLPVPVGEVRRPDDYLYAVARGCLVAAEVSQT